MFLSAPQLRALAAARRPCFFCACFYRRAGPGDALEYIYDLPPDHYPGIFYYHPHFGTTIPRNVIFLSTLLFSSFLFPFPLSNIVLQQPYLSSNV